MKQLKPLLIGVAVLLALSACDITTEPRSTVTDANVFDDADSYRALLAKIYAGLAVTGQQGPAGNPDLDPSFDEGFSHYIRLVWQMNELPADEALIAWNDQGVQELNTQGWASSNGFLGAMYNRIYFQVALVNEFLRETTDAKLAERGQTNLTDQIRGFRAEARFLRALSYWHGVDLFGNIPLVTEDAQLGARPPEQATREAVYSYIVDELNSIRSDLPPPGGAQYGRADQGALAMLLAKVYMNAEVYSGSSQYANVIGELGSVLGAYQLDDDYGSMFQADNHTSPEFIFVVPQDGDAVQSWGGTTFLAHAACGGNMNAADYGLDFCWWGLRIQPEIVALFPNAPDSPDGRAILFTDGQNLDINELTNFNDGWAAPKWTNVSSLGVGGSNVTHVSTDYPMFRLGDAYLMYAEAVLRGGGGSVAEAVGYVNQLRERAYGDQSGNITEADLTIAFILDERARELYWEGHRRMDLIRYGLFTGDSYNWAWKGGVAAGRGTESFRDLYPLPAAELGANPNLTQNTGY